ncbi:MAG: transcriptional repressor [Candidatus Heimdallarchaeota archaeon]|nr:transcriptional repressor [Candidatus Heimdallarchaeota archaeon]
MTDSIAEEPVFVKILDQSQMKLLDENIRIIKGLSGKHLSAKEIHNLYRDTSTNEFEVTLKTVYRRLEKLESAGLVIESGYRRVENSRMIEKLYTRAAIIFYRKERNGIKWWQSEEGNKQVERLAAVAKHYFKSESDVQDLILSYLERSDEVLSNFLSSGANDDILSHLMRGVGIEEIKSIITFLSIVELIKDNRYSDEINRKL